MGRMYRGKMAASWDVFMIALNNLAVTFDAMSFLLFQRCVLCKLQSFRNLWNPKNEEFQAFESEICKEHLLQKSKNHTQQNSFWRFQTSAQKDYKCSPYLVHFLSPFPKKCLAKTLMLYSNQHLCALDKGDYEDYGCRWWWSDHHKWVESTEGGPLRDGMMGWWENGKMGWWDGQPKKDAFHGRNETWKTDWNESTKNPRPRISCGGKISFRVVSVAGKPHTFRWAFLRRRIQSFQRQGKFETKEQKTWFP